jgi:hypothetical protein
VWYRVFGLQRDEVSPSKLAEHLHAQGLKVEPHFRGDDLGWTNVQLVLPGDGTPVSVDRYLTDVDEMRDELNAFAALLETMDYSPNNTKLMEHVIRTQQFIAYRKPLDHADEATLETLCEVLGKYLASNTEGILQIDGLGWFAADGERLIEEH